MRSENSEYLTINSFDCSFKCFMFFNQRNSSFWSNSTQSITVITAQQDTEINELCAVTWTIMSHTEANERLVQRKLDTQVGITTKFMKDKLNRLTTTLACSCVISKPQRASSRRNSFIGFFLQNIQDK